jgi:hypothetical protein
MIVLGIFVVAVVLLVMHSRAAIRRDVTEVSLSQTIREAVNRNIEKERNSASATRRRMSSARR